jgi:hypothetical protein
MIKATATGEYQLKQHQGKQQPVKTHHWVTLPRG